MLHLQNAPDGDVATVTPYVAGVELVPVTAAVPSTTPVLVESYVELPGHVIVTPFPPPSVHAVILAVPADEF
jgi:hypothetical protein